MARLDTSLYVHLAPRTVGALWIDMHHETAITMDWAAFEGPSTRISEATNSRKIVVLMCLHPILCLYVTIQKELTEPS